MQPGRKKAIENTLKTRCQRKEKKNKEVSKDSEKSVPLLKRLLGKKKKREARGRTQRVKPKGKIERKKGPG